MKHEGFFEDSNDVMSNSTQSQTSGQVFVSSIVRVLNLQDLDYVLDSELFCGICSFLYPISALRGIFVLVLAFLRDFVSLGLSRLATFSALILAYVLSRCRKSMTSDNINLRTNLKIYQHT